MKSLIRKLFIFAVLTLILSFYLLKRSKYKNYFTSTQQIEGQAYKIKRQYAISNYTFPHDWSLLINPEYDLCGNQNEKRMFTFVAFVILAPQHFEQRQKIRETWANKKTSDKFKVFFMLGLSHDQNVNQKLKEEALIYNDIVQEDYYDSFHNMTLKVMGAFSWISKYCSNSHFVLRINDDVVVNTYRLIEYLDGLVSTNQHKNKLIGSLFYGQGPHRNPKSAFYVPVEVFPGNDYPPFPSGIAYIISGELAKKFFEYSLNFYLRIYSDYLEGIVCSFVFFS